MLQVYTFALLKNDSHLITGSAEMELRLFKLTWLQNGVKDEETAEVTEKVKRLRTDSEVGSDDDGESADQANVSIFFHFFVVLFKIECAKQSFKIAFSNNGICIFSLG